MAIPHRITLRDIRAVLLSLMTICTKKYGRQYMRFLLWTTLHHRSRFPTAVRLGVKGFHFEAITREALACSAIRQDSVQVAERLRRRLSKAAGRRIPDLVADSRRALNRLRKRIIKLAPDTRVAAAASYGEALEQINDLFQEHAPAAAGALKAGAERLAAVQHALGRDILRFGLQCEEARNRAGENLTAFRKELQVLQRMRRETFKQARRRVRSLPREYRLLGVMELQQLRRRLDDLVPA